MNILLLITAMVQVSGFAVSVSHDIVLVEELEKKGDSNKKDEKENSPTLFDASPLLPRLNDFPCWIASSIATPFIDSLTPPPDPR